MLSKQEAKKRIQMAIDNAQEYIKNEQNFVFDRQKIEDCLKKRSAYLGLNQKIYWLDGLKKESFSSLGLSIRSSYYFIRWDSLYLAAKDKTLKEYSKFMKEAIYNGLGFIVNLEKIVIAIPMPRFTKDENRRLHNTEKPAVVWYDGFEEYYLWGIKLNKKMWEKIVSKKMSFKEIMALSNIEQRMVALKMLGAEELLKQVNAKLIDKSELGNELYEVIDVFPQKEWFLKYKCPSTNRVYVKCVDRAVGQKGSADEAQAWAHKFTLQEYLSLKNQG